MAGFRGIVLPGCFLLFSSVVSVPVQAAGIEFEEVTASAGITNEAASWGACWGDVNGDGWLDIYANNHPEEHSLFVNQQDGTFLDLHDSIMGYVKRDAHGCAWADFDRDGDQDLAQSSGGNGGRGVIANNLNQLYVNENGLLQDRAADLNVEWGDARGRSPLWFDANGDGLLDLFFSNVLRGDGGGKSVIMQQTPAGDFVEVTEQLGVQINAGVRFAQLSDMSGDGVQDLVLWRGPGGIQVYDIQNIPFQDITANVTSSSIVAGRGNAVYDFNGDLLPDIYIAQQKVASGELEQPSPQELRMGFGTDEGAVYSVHFDAAGTLQVELDGSFIALNEVFIGEAGLHPTDWSFQLDSSIGEYAYEVGTDRGIFISYKAQQGLWEFALGEPDQIKEASASLNAKVTAQGPITRVQANGFNPSVNLIRDLVFINGPNGLTNASPAWSPGPRTPAVSVVAGDFDNDTDVDVYVVNSFDIRNIANTLYENKGNTFVPVPNAGGAEGSLDGVGDNAITADYDQDGFLDIYVTNGRASPLFGRAVHQLFRNKGNNGNHWLQLDLKGTDSNAHGVGATVYVDVGGKVQMREQNGAAHKYTSNGHRLHFGLGAATVVDKVTVVWPDGEVQEITDVAADQILEIVEGDVVQPGSVGDLVWNDLNGDGVQDSAEPGFVNVSVSLADCSGNLIDTISTDANGVYEFADVIPGDYRVQVALPAGFEFSPKAQGTADTDSDVDPVTGSTACFSVVEQQARTDVDAGVTAVVIPPATGEFGDRVWMDDNGNGVQDAGEPGFAGVAVSLEDCDGNMLDSTLSDGEGRYGFGDLNPGSYRIVFTAPAGYFMSPSYEGDMRAFDSDADPLTGATNCLLLSEGQSKIGIDAGVTTVAQPTTGKIGDFVWHDLDGNGLQDNGEPGIAGVTLTLQDCQDATALVMTTTTDDSGNYLFTGLDAGGYRVSVAVPSGLTISPSMQGERGADSDIDPATGASKCFPLQEGQVRLGVDAGLM